MPEISPKAIVANPAGLADDVRVGAFSYLGPDVFVGPGTIIENGVTIMGRTTIGHHCHLMPCCVVGCPPVGVNAGAAGLCAVGDENAIREHVCIEAGDGAGRGTVIGDRNLLMVGCQVGHDAVLEGEGIFANCTTIEHHAYVEKFVRTAGSSGVAAYATIGAYTMTGGFGIIDRDAPPFAIVQAAPFRVRVVNDENLRRCGFDADAIAAVKGALRILFRGSAAIPAEQAFRSAAAKHGDNEHVRYLLESLRQTVASPTGRRRQPV
jgi:UDP-N-acetylglucosamine acyltransferase